MGRRRQFMPTQSSQRQPQSHKRHDLAHRGTIRDSMESDSVSSRLKQPTTPVTPIVSTTEAKPTPAVQTNTHTRLYSSSPNESNTDPHDYQNNNKPTKTTKKRLSLTSEKHHHFPQQEQAHFISGARLAQENLDNFFLDGASNSTNRE